MSDSGIKYKVCKKNENKTKTNVQIWENLNEWLKTLFANYSHYNSERTNKLYFEDCTLNNTKLYERFTDFMATEKQQIIDLKFVTFYNYFNKNFNYGFSNPKKLIYVFN